MSKKPLLNEEVTRQFMKLAAIPTITRDKFLSETYIEEDLYEQDEEEPVDELPAEEGAPPMEEVPDEEVADLGDMEIEPAEEAAGTAEDLAEKIVDLLADQGLVEKEVEGEEDELPPEGGEEELGGMEELPPEGGEEELLEEDELEERRGPHDVSHGRGVEGLEESIEVVDEKQLVENILSRVLRRLA